MMRMVRAVLGVLVVIKAVRGRKAAQVTMYRHKFIP